MNTSRGRTAIIAALSVVVFAGCDSNVVQPEASVTVSGTVLTQNGTAWSGGEVGIWKLDAISGLFTGGISLFASVTPNQRATTNLEGGFSFEYTGADTRTAGVPVLFLVSTRGLEHSSYTSTFTLHQGNRTLSPLRLWNGIAAPSGAPTLSQNSNLSVAWQPAPNVPSDPVEGYWITIKDESLNTVWAAREASGATGAEIPQAVLPASSTWYNVNITANYPSKNFSATELRRFRSNSTRTSLPVRSVSASEQASTAGQLVDGSFSASWTSSLPTPGTARDVSITLDHGQIRRLEQVALHGVLTTATGLVIETSTDGQGFSNLLSVDPSRPENQWVLHKLNTPKDARYLRLRFPSTDRLITITEIRALGQ